MQSIFLNKGLPVLGNKTVLIKQTNKKNLCTYHRETLILSGECFDGLPVVLYNF